MILQNVSMLIIGKIIVVDQINIHMKLYHVIIGKLKIIFRSMIIIVDVKLVLIVICVMDGKNNNIILVIIKLLNVKFKGVRKEVAPIGIRLRKKG